MVFRSDDPIPAHKRFLWDSRIKIVRYADRKSHISHRIQRSNADAAQIFIPIQWFQPNLFSFFEQRTICIFTATAAIGCFDFNPFDIARTNDQAVSETRVFGSVQRRRMYQHPDNRFGQCCNSGFHPHISQPHIAAEHRTFCDAQ